MAITFPIDRTSRHSDGAAGFSSDEARSLREAAPLITASDGEPLDHLSSPSKGTLRTMGEDRSKHQTVPGRSQRWIERVGGLALDAYPCLRLLPVLT